MIKVKCNEVFSKLPASPAPVNGLFCVASIIMAGATTLKDDLIDKEKMRLELVCRKLILLGIAINTDEVDVCDLDRGHDYAQSSTYADLVTFNWWNKDIDNARGRHQLAKSPVLTDEFNIADVLRRNRPKFVANITDGHTCIAHSDIPEDYYTRMETEIEPLDSIAIFARNDLPFELLNQFRYGLK